MPGATIREARIKDAHEIADLISELGYPTGTDEMEGRLKALLAEAHYVSFVAELDGRVLGLAGASLHRYFEKNGLYARLLVLVVADTGRSLGIGGLLIEKIECWARDAGARELFVNSGTHRVRAHRFYEQRSFRPTGLRFVKQLNPPD